MNSHAEAKEGDTRGKPETSRPGSPASETGIHRKESGNHEENWKLTLV